MNDNYYYTYEDFAEDGGFIDNTFANQPDFSPLGPDPFSPQVTPIHDGMPGIAVDFSEPIYQQLTYFGRRPFDGEFLGIPPGQAAAQLSPTALPAQQQPLFYGQDLGLSPPSQGQLMQVDQTSGSVGSSTQQLTSRVPCLNCDRDFANKDSLRKHHALKHSGAEPKKFPCDTCDESFADDKGVRRHRDQAHPPDNRQPRKFLCPGCKKRFSRQDNTVRHMKKKHPELLRKRQGGRIVPEGVHIERV